jgi:Dihydrodipicolinate synthase/N-acetylneuraminate lyase
MKAEHKKYYGVIPPIITPIDEHENVDEDGFRGLLDYCIAHGLHGIFVAGSNGETMALTQEQRNRAIKIAVDQCADRVPVMSGVMDTSTRRVIDNIKALEQAGGTCAVITSIFYARHTSQSETIRHFEEIARHTDIDLMIYNIPMFTGMTLTPDTIEEIAKIPSVKGYKDSSGQFSAFQKLLPKFVNLDFSMLQGATVYAMSSMLLGADGFVPSIAPLFPELFVESYEVSRQGNIPLAIRYDELLRETSKILAMSKSATAANKFALSTLGFTSPWIIQPQDTCTKEDEQKILRQIDVVNEKYEMLKQSIGKK